VLITGGTGAIGGHAARWLAGRGCPHVVLASRSGPAAAGTAGLAAGLARTGTAASVLAADAGSRGHTSGVLAWAGSAGPRLCGVLHTAGMVQDTPLEEATVAELGEVLAAKASGAVHLHELTAGLGLDVFVLFSSIAAAGSPGTRRRTRSWTRWPRTAAPPVSPPRHWRGDPGTAGG
jgi:NAD(P)-dependent dehydrogenase (short-subunit alcohol dehydrogenase family)